MDFYNYKEYMTAEQFAVASTITNEDELLKYIAESYDCYVNTHSKEHTFVITNPDALFRTPEAQAVFVEEFKKYIRDVMGIKREEVQNGNNNSNRTDKKTTKNK